MARFFRKIDYSKVNEFFIVERTKRDIKNTFTRQEANNGTLLKRIDRYGSKEEDITEVN